MMQPIYLFDALAGRNCQPRYQIAQRLGGSDVYISRNGFGFAKTDNPANAMLFRTRMGARLMVWFALPAALPKSAQTVKPSGFKIVDTRSRKSAPAAD